jgi:hypothetical protein
VNFANSVSYGCGETGPNTATLRVTDEAGNSATCPATVTVKDVTPPSITGRPANVTVNTGAGRSTCDQTASWTPPTASDNCSVANFTSNYAPGSVFPVGITTVIYTATDPSGNSKTCSFTVTVVDTTPPTITPPANISVNKDPGQCTAKITVPAATTGDNCGVASVVNTFNGTDSASGTYPLGVTTVKWTVTDIHGNNSCASMTVTVVDPAPAVAATPSTQSVFYGCPLSQIAFTVSDADSAFNLVTLSSFSYTFNGGSAITGLPSWAGLTSAGDDQNWYITGTAGMPGTYVITLNFLDACGKPGVGSATIIVNKTPTSPVADTYYTGPTFYWTTAPNSSSATLTLTATIKTTKCVADIRTATISFYIRDPLNPTSLTPINGAQNLPVGLVNPGDITTGTAGANVQYNIGSATATTLNIAVIVGGNFSGNDPTTDQLVTVATPVTGGQICGGGTINNRASAGYLKGSATDAACFSFFVQYNKSGTNPKGSVQIFDKSYYKPDGTLDTVLHTYMFKSTAISVLSVTIGNGTTPSKAQFSSKANLIEILPNGSESSIEGNDIMTLSLTDNTIMSNNTKPNTLGVTIQRSAGGTWYSSDWNGAMTIEQTPASGTVSVK